jgi:hypothetical protein
VTSRSRVGDGNTVELNVGVGAVGCRSRGFWERDCRLAGSVGWCDIEYECP